MTGMTEAEWEAGADAYRPNKPAPVGAPCKFTEEDSVGEPPI
jgi:hypothetical protein